MGGGVGTRLQKLCNGIAAIIFLAMSAYLLIELVIALSDQGQPTGAVVPITSANPVFPEWYQAPTVLAAVSVSLVAYPLAAVFYGISLLSGFLARERPEPAPRMAPIAPATAPEARNDDGLPLPSDTGDEVCILGADLRILAISTAMARLFGLSPREMIGLSVEAFIAPHDLSNFASVLLAAQGRSAKTMASTIAIRLPGDRVVPVDVSCRMDTEAATAGLGTLVLTFHALSERSRLDNQLAAVWY